MKYVFIFMVFGIFTYWQIITPGQQIIEGAIVGTILGVVLALK